MLVFNTQYPRVVNALSAEVVEFAYQHVEVTVNRRGAEHICQPRPAAPSRDAAPSLIAALIADPLSELWTPVLLLSIGWPVRSSNPLANFFFFSRSNHLGHSQP